jgi:DNA-binding protein H-NS
MHKTDLGELPTDQLWDLYEFITETLADRIIAEKQELESKLELLNKQALAKKGVPHAKRERRKYPKVIQKYRNPQEPSQTWSGRGKQPGWVAKLLRSGARLDDMIMPEYRRLARKAA